MVHAVLAQYVVITGVRTAAIVARDSLEYGGIYDAVVGVQ